MYRNPPHALATADGSVTQAPTFPIRQAEDVMRSYRDAKAMAQILRETLAIRTISISHSESLELVSKMLGFSDWNTLSAKIQKEHSDTALLRANGNGSSSPEDDRAQKLADQSGPRKAVPFDPTNFDRFIGMYKSLSHSGIYFEIFRDGTKFFSQITGQTPVEIYPESETKFFATVVSAQISFLSDESGRVTELILHQSGLEQHWKRDDQATSDGVKAALEKRIRENTPHPGSQAALRRFISGIISGKPNYDEMADEQAKAIREQIGSLQPLLVDAGAIKSLKFIGVDDRGDDIYHVTHERRLFRWSIFLNPEGKVDRSWVMSGG
jgi:hypothetical protein